MTRESASPGRERAVRMAERLRTLVGLGPTKQQVRAELQAALRREQALTLERSTLAEKLRDTRHDLRAAKEDRRRLASELRTARDQARAARTAGGSRSPRFVHHRAGMGNLAPLVLHTGGSGLSEATWFENDARRDALARFVATSSSDAALGERDTPLLITGTPRSGTSMLNGMLAGKAGFGTLRSESEPLRLLAIAAQRSIEHTRRSGSAYFRDVDAARAHFGEQIDRFLQASFPDEIPLLKQPGIAPLVPLLHELMPSLRTLVIVRDPRDVVASTLDWVERTELAGRQHVFAGLSTRELASHLLEYLLPLIDLSGSGSTRLAMVRYEELVGAPETTLTRIERQLGIPGELVGRDLDWRVDYGGDSGESSAVTPLYGQAPTASQVGRFRERLDDESIAVVTEVFGPLLLALGLQEPS